MSILCIMLCTCCSGHGPIGFRSIPYLPLLCSVSQGDWPLWFFQAARSPVFQLGSANEKHWAGGREKPGCLSPRKPLALL